MPSARAKLTLYLPSELVERIDEARDLIPRNAYLVRAIETYIDRETVIRLKMDSEAIANAVLDYVHPDD